MVSIFAAVRPSVSTPVLQYQRMVDTASELKEVTRVSIQLIELCRDKAALHSGTTITQILPPARPLRPLTRRTVSSLAGGYIRSRRAVRVR